MRSTKGNVVAGQFDTAVRDLSELDQLLLSPTWGVSDQAKKHAELQRLRDEAPVRWVEDRNFGKSYWYITRHADVVDVLGDPSAFSNRLGPRVPNGPVRLTPERRNELGMDVSIGSTDDPVHAAYRRPMNKHFTAGAIARLEATVDGHVTDLLSEAAERGTFDVVADLAAELPVRVVLSFLGIPADDWTHVQHLAHMWGMPFDPRVTIDDDPEFTALEGRRLLREYSTELADSRRAKPAGDFVSLLTDFEFDGGKYSNHEVVSWMFSLIIGGLETTRNGASIAIWKLMQDRKQQDIISSQPEHMATSLEEIIRWASPQRSLMRIAAKNVIFREQKINVGDWVICSLESANRDERTFTDPQKLDLTRAINPHVGFGQGIHRCLGLVLAKLELRTLLPRVFNTFPELTPVSDEVHWLSDINSNGLADLLVDTNGTVRLSRR
jgi:cholest-4-en-3-one 26-monooxygenase